MDMIKPGRLHRGDKVAVVSLSSGMLGEKRYMHKYELGKSRLQDLFGLEAVAMPNALKGIRYLYEHPEKRAEDWMMACEDSSIKAIITSIGGDDGISLLPYVDFDVLHRNPKVFLGYSDTTAHYLMMCRAGVVSFYGPALMSDFAAYGSMPDYTVRAVQELLFEGKDRWEIEKCPYWEKGSITWSKKNIDRQEERLPDPGHGRTLKPGMAAFSSWRRVSTVLLLPIFLTI